MPKSSSPAYFAILSDIHANIDALEAVLKDSEEWPVRGLFCLGDTVGYGPEPARCVQLMMEHSSVSLLGNHEAMLFLPEDSSDALGDIAPPLTLARKQLNEEQLRWVKSSAIVADLDPIMLCHASLHEPASFPYIDSEEEAELNFAAQTAYASFHGHTHIPAIWENKEGRISVASPNGDLIALPAGNHYAINVGSVGQPRDGKPEACYALYDYQNRVIVHRRIPYDIRKAQARFKKAGLPSFFSRRLKKGQ